MLSRRLAATAAALLPMAFAARAQPSITSSITPPITIGFGMALTGGLAPNGKAALFAMQIWERETNARGGLLGRPVKLVYYDDQSNPSTVPGLYTKLLDVDKVDLVVSGYATNMIAPAMPVVMGHNRTFLALVGTAVNEEFHYDKYFAIAPAGGPKPKETFARAFLGVAMQQTPKPKTIALIGADAEFPRNAMDGARTVIAELGLKIVYDKTYPPTTTDYSPIVRAIQATGPDVVMVCSYPPDSVGMIRAANEVGLRTRMFGGAMVGLQNTAIKVQLGPLLNGIVNYDYWLPWSALASEQSLAFIKTYQSGAPALGVDALGYFLPPFAYAYMEVLRQAVETANSLDQEKLAAALRAGTFRTIVGDIRFGANGEWIEPRVLSVQFQNLKPNNLDQFRDPRSEVILWPPALRTGDIQYPYGAAKP